MTVLEAFELYGPTGVVVFALTSVIIRLYNRNVEEAAGRLADEKERNARYEVAMEKLVSRYEAVIREYAKDLDKLSEAINNVRTKS